MDPGLERALADVFRSARAEQQLRVIGLPSGSDPRVVLPARGGRATGGMLRSQYAGGGSLRRFKVVALSALVTTGAARLIPSWRASLDASGSSPALRDWMGRTLGQPYAVGIVLLGPPRANRKPVVMILDARRHLLAVAKIGCNDVTRPLVRHEAAALDEVASALAERVHTPRLLGTSRVGQTEVMMMAPLPAVDTSRGVPRGTLVEIVGRISDVAGPGAPLSDTLVHERMSPLGEAIPRIQARTARIPVGAVHGDLHPGNLGTAADGRPVLWDWERWSHGVPRGFDLLHHDLQSWITVDGIAPRDAARRLVASAPGILAPLGVSDDYAPDVARDYLVRIAARYIADAQDRAGSPLGAVEEWLFPAVLEDRRDKESP